MGKKAIIISGIAVAVLVAGGLLVASGSSDKKASSNSDVSVSDAASDSTSSPNTVTISDFAYGPEELTVKKGTTVTWVNEDPTQHNVVFDDESVGTVDDSKLISKGEKVTFTFNETGSFPYFCMPHPYMKATVKVTE